MVSPNGRGEIVACRGLELCPWMQSFCGRCPQDGDVGVFSIERGNRVAPLNWSSVPSFGVPYIDYPSTSENMFVINSTTGQLYVSPSLSFPPFDFDFGVRVFNVGIGLTDVSLAGKLPTIAKSITNVTFVVVNVRALNAATGTLRTS